MLTRVFKNGNSLAVRLPKEYALPEGEVEIIQRDGELVIRPVTSNLLQAWDALDGFSDDFMSEGYQKLPTQDRIVDFD